MRKLAHSCSRWILLATTLGTRVQAQERRIQEAENFLEKKFKGDVAFSYDDTVQTAIAALQSILSEDFKAKEIEVGVVSASDPFFRILPDEEVEEHLIAISERD
eukprot:jgi/Botrbrau1/11247/Bobra.0038s0019.1